MMKVLQLSTSDNQGGAAIAACRLHKGLRALGIDSSMLVNKRVGHGENIVGPSAKFDKVMSRVSPLLDRLPGRFSRLGLDRTSSAWVPDRLTGRVNSLAADILNLHWINDGFMRIETLPKFRQPVGWTLHDMWPFCGGEHYVGESVRYKEGYSTENRPESETVMDINRWIWARKRRAWAGMQQLVVVTPSRWLAGCASESALFGRMRIEVLPNGIDHERFHPMEHAVARNILGLPVDRKLILFGAGSATSDKRKGFHLLVDALNKLELKTGATDYDLVVFGATSGDTDFAAKTHYLGRLYDEISMAIVYAAADVFVAPSVEDNLPNTVLEALSCGTPVVAFNIGGMPDMVAHKSNGYLARGFDTSRLAEGLSWVMDDEQRWKKLSDEARSTVTRSFTLGHSANRYMDLYNDILEDV